MYIYMCVCVCVCVLILLLKINKKAYESEMDLSGVIMVQNLVKIRHVSIPVQTKDNTQKLLIRSRTFFRYVFSDTGFICYRSGSGLEIQQGICILLNKM